MNQSMTPEQRQLLIAGYVLNDLSDEEAAIVEGLLADAEVMQEIEQMQFTLEQVYAPEEILPAPQLRAAVMTQAVGIQEDVQAVEPTIRSRSEALSIDSLPQWVKVLGAFAALLVAGLGLSNYFLWRSLRLQQAGLDSEPLVFSLQPTENISLTPEVVVEVNPATLKGTLNIENLPSLEPGKVYVLWTVLTPEAPFTKDSKNAILTQVFTVAGEGEQNQSIVLPSAFQDPNLVTAIAVTVEDANAPQRHESLPILIEKL
ncbi:MAG: hypothetical protein ACFBSC_02635 [Microcoleaceae cyanobacterium]